MSPNRAAARQRPGTHLHGRGKDDSQVGALLFVHVDQVRDGKESRYYLDVLRSCAVGRLVALLQTGLQRGSQAASYGRRWCRRRRHRRWRSERWKVTAARAVSRRAAWGEPNWVGAWPWPRSVWRVCATVSIRNLAVSASLRSLFFTPEERGQWMKVRRAQARGQPRKVAMVVQGTHRQPGRASSTQAECFAL